MMEKWGCPPIGVAIADTPAGGHELIMLDYRTCGKRGEPQVMYVDQEEGCSTTVVAPNFETHPRLGRGVQVQHRRARPGWGNCNDIVETAEGYRLALKAETILLDRLATAAGFDVN